MRAVLRVHTERCSYSTRQPSNCGGLNPLERQRRRASSTLRDEEYEGKVHRSDSPRDVQWIAMDGHGSLYLTRPLAAASLMFLMMAKISSVGLRTRVLSWRASIRLWESKMGSEWVGECRNVPKRGGTWPCSSA